MNEKLVLEEKHRESLVRALVADKELVQVQNGKLMQLLEVRDAAINAIVEGVGDIGEIKMADIGSMAGSKEKWMALAKENFKDANVRRTAIDKYILQ